MEGLKVRVLRSGSNYQVMSYNDEIEVFYYYGYITAFKIHNECYRKDERATKFLKENNFHQGKKLHWQDLEKKFDNLINRMVFKKVTK